MKLNSQFKLIYNGEFDPGSGWTLAAGLIHASRGAAQCSNTWAAKKAGKFFESLEATARKSSIYSKIILAN